MKIAISSTEPSLDAQMDERFGRCPCFVISDSEGVDSDLVENSFAHGSAAGIQAARLLADRDVSVVLTGRCGPNASDTLEAAGIQVVTGCGGTVRHVLDRFLGEIGESPDASSERPAADGASSDGVAPATGGRTALQREFEEGVDSREEWYLRSLPGI